MRKSFVLFLWLFLLIFVLASVYISFSAYLAERDRRVFANVSTFFISVSEGKERIELPYPEDTVLVLLRKPDKRFLSKNILSDIDRDEYVFLKVSVGKDSAYMYVKRISLTDYLHFVFREPIYTGLLVASLLLYISVFYFTIREFELTQGSGVTEELTKRLKALRLMLATFKIIPEESVDEMKKVVDSILRYRVSKK